MSYCPITPTLLLLPFLLLQRSEPLTRSWLPPKSSPLKDLLSKISPYYPHPRYTGHSYEGAFPTAGDPAALSDAISNDSVVLSIRDNIADVHLRLDRFTGALARFEARLTAPAQQTAPPPLAPAPVAAPVARTPPDIALVAPSPSSAEGALMRMEGPSSTRDARTTLRGLIQLSYSTSPPLLLLLSRLPLLV
ncbi:hypothetical protein B0H19DRAFT_1248949 [Mycena capillaripes]|nr:hypothetical protein B0H19DRAFT_1248949 [Mycena capillaripes]